MSSGWIGVDFDATLVTYPPKPGQEIGEPIQPMVDRVRKWLAQGKDVRIFTARVVLGELACEAISVWCIAQFGKALPITNEKDLAMIALYDDRAIQVEPNTGNIMGRPYYAH